MKLSFTITKVPNFTASRLKNQARLKKRGVFSSPVGASTASRWKTRSSYFCAGVLIAAAQSTQRDTANVNKLGVTLRPLCLCGEWHGKVVGFGRRSTSEMNGEKTEN